MSSGDNLQAFNNHRVIIKNFENDEDKIINLSLGYSENTKLSNVLLKENIWLNMPCAEKGRCGKCKVKAVGNISPLSEGEQKLLSKTEIENDVRLACMSEIRGEVYVTLIENKKRLTIQMEGVLSKDIPLKPWGNGYGVAIDVGTTTLAFYLYHLESGILIGKNATVNPQSIFGADVISRIEKALAGEHDKIATVIQEEIINSIAVLCRDSGYVKASQITSVVITGNTAMMYLLCNYCPESIATAPFEQDRFFGEFINGDLIGFNKTNNLNDAQVYLPRCISAYVGGDMTTAAIASGILESEKTLLLVDIGTNGELLLNANEKWLACSTAAGPALEGAGISCGMPAQAGAIDKVFIVDDELRFKVIGDVPPVGICGSGIIDLTAVLLQLGVLDETGLIEDSGHRFIASVMEVNGQPAFNIPGSDIVITQRDIRAIQLSKASICAGISTLIQMAGCSNDDVDELIIAGGFGSFINVDSAEKIGLIPTGFANIAHSIGNAAAAGASVVLKNSDFIEISEAFAKKVYTVELSTNEIFMDEYINGMMF